MMLGFITYAAAALVFASVRAQNEICCESSGMCFTDDPPFDGTLWPLPECHVPIFILDRSDMAASEEITRDNIPEAFVPTDVTVYIVGGWQGIGQVAQDALRDTFINSETPYNVITVDWSVGASGGYLQSASNVRVTGCEISDINILLAPDYSWCVGNSLGAHSCGHAGKHGGNLNRITGLDPTGPSFDEPGCQEQAALCKLHPTDAGSVDAIHTAVNVSGSYNPVGHLDFFPNGGISQPGCPVPDNNFCSHIRSYEYFTESLVDDCFVVTQNCTDETSLPDSCGPCGGDGCPNMGASASSGYGIFYLETAASSPYCLGAFKV